MAPGDTTVGCRSNRPRRERGEGEEGQQDEIHLPGLRPERLGEAGRALDLRCVLRGYGVADIFVRGRRDLTLLLKCAPSAGWSDGQQDFSCGRSALWSSGHTLTAMDGVRA
jgi:hypothetical protein